MMVCFYFIYNPQQHLLHIFLSRKENEIEIYVLVCFQQINQVFLKKGLTLLIPLIIMISCIFPYFQINTY